MVQKRVRMSSELSDELEDKVWMHQASVMSTCLPTSETDVIELARVRIVLLFADDSVLMSGMRDKFKNGRRLLRLRASKLTLGES